MFSTKLLKLAVDRSLGKPTKNQGELFEELYKEYMGDPNSSTLREQITAAVAGCKTIPGKLGRDAIDINGVEKEIKPKNYTGKRTNGAPNLVHRHVNTCSSFKRARKHDLR